MRVDECWALFIYTRFMLVDGNVTRRSVWIWAPFIVSIYVIPSSFLLPLKFQFIPTLLEIFHSSVNILLNILCMNIQIFTMLCPGHVKICENFVTVPQTIMGSKYGVHMSLLSDFTNIAFFGWNFCLWWLCQCALLLSVAESQPSVVHSFSASSLAVNGGVG